MPMPPCPFPPSTLAPSQAELDWLYDWLADSGNEMIYSTAIIEAGCGITTHAILNGLRSDGHNEFVYLAIEDYEPCVLSVKSNYPEVFIEKTWDNINTREWDLCFVDSSCGCNRRGLNRELFIQNVEQFMCTDCAVIIHDWHARSGKAARHYLETCGKYELIDAFMGRTGLGIYRRV